MSDHDLHDQLERLGRQPVPPPRPEFVESLLARIQLTDDLSEPAPVIYLHRQSWARVRMVMAGAAAAVLLGAVGMVALARDGSDPSTELSVDMASGSLTPAQAEGGRLVSDFGQFPDGEYAATCTQGGEIKFEGKSITCETDEVLDLEIREGRIVSAVVRDETTESPTTVGEDPSPELSTTVTQQELSLRSTDREGGVRLEWLAARDSEAVRYVVTRAVGQAGVTPAPLDTPTSGTTTQKLSATAADESFDDLKPSDDKVAYRVFALDDDGEVVAQSGTLTLTLKWEPTGTTR